MKKPSTLEILTVRVCMYIIGIFTLVLILKDIEFKPEYPYLKDVIYYVMCFAMYIVIIPLSNILMRSGRNFK